MAERLRDRLPVVKTITARFRAHQALIAQEEQVWRTLYGPVTPIDYRTLWNTPLSSDMALLSTSVEQEEALHRQNLQNGVANDERTVDKRGTRGMTDPGAGWQQVDDDELWNRLGTGAPQLVTPNMVEPRRGTPGYAKVIQRIFNSPEEVERLDRLAREGTQRLSFQPPRESHVHTNGHTKAQPRVVELFDIDQVEPPQAEVPSVTQVTIRTPQRVELFDIGNDPEYQSTKAVAPVAHTIYADVKRRHEHSVVSKRHERRVADQIGVDIGARWEEGKAKAEKQNWFARRKEAKAARAAVQPAVRTTPEPIVDPYMLYVDMVNDSARKLTEKRTQKEQKAHAKAVENDLRNKQEKPAQPIKLTVIQGGRTHASTGMPAYEAETIIDRQVDRIAVRQEIKRAVREFSEQAEAGRGPDWFDAPAARDMYLSLLDHLIDGPQNAHLTNRDAAEQVQQIAHDLLKYVQTRNVKTWADVIPISEIGNMAGFLNDYFGREYHAKMKGKLKGRARKQFFETFINGYTSAKQSASQITAQAPRRVA